MVSYSGLHNIKNSSYHFWNITDLVNSLTHHWSQKRTPEAHNTAVDLKPLPPVFEPHQVDSLKECLTDIVTGDFSILPLIRKCAAISVNGHVIGSTKSRYTTSSVIMVDGSALRVAEIQYFFSFDVDVCQTGLQTFDYAALCFYFPHECKVWFGYPTEVWSCVTCPDVCFIPIDHLKAYSKQKVNFGRRIGEDSVLIISPLL